MNIFGDEHPLKEMIFPETENKNRLTDYVHFVKHGIEKVQELRVDISVA
jgi:hypothetical protein